jgi:hypothetical protein
MSDACMEGEPGAGAACTPRPRSIPAVIARVMSSVTPSFRSDAPGSAASTRESPCWFADPRAQLVQPMGVAGPGGGPSSEPPTQNTIASTPEACWFSSQMLSPPVAAVASVSAATPPPRASEQPAVESDSEDEGEDEFEGEGGEEGGADGVASRAPQLGKLWGSEQFPEGSGTTYACWDWANIMAAQEWVCPCKDRRNCIGRERLRPEDLLLHRKEYQTTRPTNR